MFNMHAAHLKCYLCHILHSIFAVRQGKFPDEDSAEDGYHGVSPVKAFPPQNNYGRWDFAGFSRVIQVCQSRLFCAKCDLVCKAVINAFYAASSCAGFVRAGDTPWCSLSLSLTTRVV